MFIAYVYVHEIKIIKIIKEKNTFEKERIKQQHT